MKCKPRQSRFLLAGSLITLLAVAGWASSPGPTDPPSGGWPMWGGTPDRNMISSMKGLPTTWNLSTKNNIKW
ncbi:MAG: hypothetical protein ACE5JI_17285, partial [Acidobacteriota bacterium]